MKSRDGLTPGLVASSAAVFLLGALVAWVPLTSASVPLRETTRYPIWVFLMGLIFGLCPMVWVHGRGVLDSLEFVGAGRREKLIYGAWAAVAIAALVGGAVLARFKLSLPHAWLRYLVMYSAVALAIAPGVFVIWRVGQAVSRERPTTAQIVCWRRSVRSILATLGGMIALGTITTAALRNAMLAAPGVAPGDFPGERIVLLGAAWTLVLAIVYVPVATRLRQRAQEWVDEVTPMPVQFAGDWRDDIKARTELAEALGAEESSVASIQNALVIAGPLLTSALSLFLPGK